MNHQDLSKMLATGSCGNNYRGEIYVAYSGKKLCRNMYLPALPVRKTAENIYNFDHHRYVLSQPSGSSFRNFRLAIQAILYAAVHGRYFRPCNFLLSGMSVPRSCLSPPSTLECTLLKKGVEPIIFRICIPIHISSVALPTPEFRICETFPATKIFSH